MAFCFFLIRRKSFLCLFFFSIVAFAEHQKDFYHQKQSVELSSTERTAEKLALFAERDEVAPSVLATPKSDGLNTAQRMAQHKPSKNLEGKSAQMVGPMVGNSDQNDPNFGSALGKKRPPGMLRLFFSRVHLFNRSERIAKLYQKLKNAPGGWGELVRKMFAEMLLAKKFGIGDSEPLRENCRRALQLIGEGKGVERADVRDVEPFRDFLTLLKSSAQSLLSLFKGPSKRSESRKQRKANILRALKTFAENDNSFFLRMVRKGGKMDDDGHTNRRRRHKRLAPLVIFGIIIGGLMVIAFLSEMSRTYI